MRLSNHKELVSEVVRIVKDKLFYVFQAYYQRFKTSSPKRFVLRDLQDYMRAIAKWDDAQIDKQCDCFDESAKDRLTVLLACIAPKHDLYDVLHTCFTAVAREVFKNPAILYDGVDTIQYQNNMLAFDRIVKSAVRSVIRSIQPCELTVVPENEEDPLEEQGKYSEEHDVLVINEEDTLDPPQVTSMVDQAIQVCAMDDIQTVVDNVVDTICTEAQQYTHTDCEIKIVSCPNDMSYMNVKRLRQNKTNGKKRARGVACEPINENDESLADQNAAESVHEYIANLELEPSIDKHVDDSVCVNESVCEPLHAQDLVGSVCASITEDDKGVDMSREDASVSSSRPPKSTGSKQRHRMSYEHEQTLPSDRLLASAKQIAIAPLPHTRVTRLNSRNSPAASKIMQKYALYFGQLV
jgi:hypothetical protein